MVTLPDPIRTKNTFTMCTHRTYLYFTLWYVVKHSSMIGLLLTPVLQVWLLLCARSKGCCCYSCRLQQETSKQAKPLAAIQVLRGQHICQRPCKRCPAPLLALCTKDCISNPYFHVQTDLSMNARTSPGTVPYRLQLGNRSISPINAATSP